MTGSPAENGLCCRYVPWPISTRSSASPIRRAQRTLRPELLAALRAAPCYCAAMCTDHPRHARQHVGRCRHLARAGRLHRRVATAHRTGGSVREKHGNPGAQPPGNEPALSPFEPFKAPRVPGSAGLRLPYTEVRTGRWSCGEAQLDLPCAANETGAVVVRGPHVGPGYTEPARNAGMFDREWLISGDLGHIGRRPFLSRAGSAAARLGTSALRGGIASEDTCASAH